MARPAKAPTRGKKRAAPKPETADHDEPSIPEDASEAVEEDGASSSLEAPDSSETETEEDLRISRDAAEADRDDLAESLIDDDDVTFRIEDDPDVPGDLELAEENRQLRAQVERWKERYKNARERMEAFNKLGKTIERIGYTPPAHLRL